jgi:murein endopeptidase
MEVIGAVADRLATGDAYTPFGVGNISLPAGGPFKGHDGHKDGLGIDVRPARVDGAQQPVTYRDKQYDRAATQRMVDAFRASGQVDKIYFNDPMIRGVQPWRGHDNHFHVQIKQ